MESMNQKVSTWFTLNRLESATDNLFESYAHFFLYLIHRNYRSTRRGTDEGIDGYIRVSKMGIMRSKLDYFSIYGPTSKTLWRERRKKINDDLKNIVKHAKSNKTEIITWNLVLNFETTKAQEGVIEEMCVQHNVKYNIYTPLKMIAALKTPDQIYQATAFTDSVEIDEDIFLNLTDFHYHKFAEKTLKLLLKKENSTTTEKKDLLDSLAQSILFYLPQEVFEKFNTTNHTSIYIKRAFIKNTSIYYPEAILIHRYIPDEKRFFVYNLKEAEVLGLIEKTQSEIQKNEKNEYFIRVDNLYIIYRIIEDLRKQLNRVGRYSLENAIKKYDLKRKRSIV